MFPESIQNAIILYFKQQGEREVEIISASPVSGGSINDAFRIKTSLGQFFVKYNDASRYPEMFEKESRGLQLLRDSNSISIPDILTAGEAGSYAFLLLEFIEPAREADHFWQNFGKNLAAMHSHKAEKFGLDHDNYMGSLYQYNNFHDNWTEFFIVERLERQVKMAREDGSIGRVDITGFERLYKRLDEIFPSSEPSLIHGDLWSGNFMTDRQGNACLIDPAVYYGHPEIDIAMSTLFGGFNQKFYDAYNNHNPLEKGWEIRLDIYNLYPLMVHVNLFGGGYLGSVQKIVRKF
nr:fructosamine kinase family protein [Bacteroidota bacterium]